jgi:hypothetical protein
MIWLGVGLVVLYVVATIGCAVTDDTDEQDYGGDGR